MSILQLKNGQYRGFTELQVAYEVAVAKRITDTAELDKAKAVAEQILTAGVTAGLQGLTPAQEREIIYSRDNGWLDIINFIDNTKV